MAHTIEEIVAGHYRHFKERTDQTWWAWNAVHAIMSDGSFPQKLDIVLRLIASTDDEDYIGSVAAGELEDLLYGYGAKAVQLLESAAAASPKVRRALKGVWLDDEDEAYLGLELLLKKYCGLDRTMPPMDALPGAELIEEGLRDLARGAETQAALLVSIGAPKLRSLGIEVPEPALADPENRLYALLAKEDSDSAHGRYNALIRRLISFERATACAR